MSDALVSALASRKTANAYTCHSALALPSPRRGGEREHEQRQQQEPKQEQKQQRKQEQVPPPIRETPSATILSAPAKWSDTPSAREPTTEVGAGRALRDKYARQVAEVTAWARQCADAEPDLFKGAKLTLLPAEADPFAIPYQPRLLEPFVRPSR